MKKTLMILIGGVLLTTGCVIQFIPEIDKEEEEFIVVEGLVTDQNESYKIKLSQSVPIEEEFKYMPLSGCVVTVTDDNGGTYNFIEITQGEYYSNPSLFQAIIGRKYTLHITCGSDIYESESTELLPVPGIDTIYARFEKNGFYHPGDTLKGYQIYVSAHDPTNRCKFYRWTYDETWEFKLRTNIPEHTKTICYKSASSQDVYIRNTTNLGENRIEKNPLVFLTTETDRLMRRYSMLLKQYSLNEKEFFYWDNINKISNEVGGLYDVVPASVKGNVICTSDPSKKARGYFSVSSVKSKRIFLEYQYARYPNFYADCPIDTIETRFYDPYVYRNAYLYEWFELVPLCCPMTRLEFYALTIKKQCIDCTLTGSLAPPDFWNTDEKGVIIQQLDDDKNQ